MDPDSGCSDTMELDLPYAEYAFGTVSSPQCPKVFFPVRAIRFKEQIDIFCMEKAHRAFEIGDDGWEELVKLCKWLEPFYEATQRMSASKVVTLSFTYLFFFDLQDILRGMMMELVERKWEHLRRGLADAHEKLREYLGLCNMSPLYVWAAGTCCLRFRFRELTGRSVRSSREGERA